MDSPWSNKDTLETKDRLARLSKEVVDFEKYISPTKKEKLNRDTLLYSISQLVESLWPNNSKITSFGSSVTGLVFPSSDVDINIDFDVLPKNNKIDVLKIIRKQAINERMFRWDDTTLAANAKVPVLMATDENQVSIDITIDNECFSSDRTAAWVKEYPALKPLFMALKQSIGNFRVSNAPAFEPLSAKTAGLASYSLICLIVSYLQLKELKGNSYIDTSDPSNYGALLMGFLSFYSSFNNEGMAISLTDENLYIPADVCPIPFEKKRGKLYIIDPDVPGVNVGRSTIKFDVIKFIFKSAHERLVNKMSSCGKGESVLSSILKVEHHYHCDPRRQGSRFKAEKIHVENGAPKKKHPFDRNRFGGRRGGMPYNKDRGRHNERDDRRNDRNEDSNQRGEGSRYRGGYKSGSSNKSYDVDQDANAVQYRRHKQNNNYHLAEHYKKKHIHSRR